MRVCPECGREFPDDISVCSHDGVSLNRPGEADTLIGRTVGSYVVTRLLGRGGMGAVYQGEHPTIGSRVAVKFLHRRFVSEPAIVDRFLNEARAVNLIGHDNIVDVSDFSRLEDGTPFFVMEFLDGQALSRLVGKPQSLELVGPIVLQCADGLQAAHEKGIVHRDLKPDNVFLVVRGRRANVVKIVDFGIAKVQHAGVANGRTQTGMVMGTAHYMSPEQAGGEVGRIGPASDVYSLGVIMYQLATGRLPFSGANFGEILVGHLLHAPRQPREIEPSIPPAYEEIILRCLAKKPEARFQSMSELYDALAAVMDDLGLSHDPPLARAISQPPPDAHPTLPPTLPLRQTPVPAIATHEATSERATALISADTSAVTTRAPMRHPRRTSQVLLLIGGLALVLGGATVGVQYLPATPSEPAPIVALAEPSAEPAPPPPPSEPATAEVRFESEPSGARIVVTQAETRHEGITPVAFTLERGIAASANVEAPEHLPANRELTPQEDMVIALSLAAAPKPITRRAARKQPPRPAEPPKPESTIPAVVGDGIVEIDLD